MKYIFVLLLAFSTFSANAEETNLRYELFWSGFKVGEMNLKLKEEGNKYDYLSHIESKNLLKYFTEYWSVNRTQGKIIGSLLIPEIYESRWSRKKDRQEIEVSYKKDGSIREVIKTPEDRKKHPEVSEKLKKNALDPITASIASRNKIRKIIESGANFPAKFTIPVFDAKRRFDVEHVINGYKNINVSGKDRNLLHVQFQRTPIAGFRANELKRMDEHDPVVDVYLDKNFIPVWGYGKAGMGTATIRLAENEK